MCKKRKDKEKIVLFPGLVDKLVTKGMDHLKEKNLTEALSYFQQSLEIEDDHPQGRFGVALCLVEMGRLEEALDKTEQMLKEDIGHYYDILQVHISLLVQLGKYKEVVTMLEGIMAEEKLPVNQAESLYHLLHFSRQMVDAGDAIEIEEIDETSNNMNDLIDALYHASIDQQRSTIKLLMSNNSERARVALKQFLKDEEQDPVLKSFILQMFKQNKIEDCFEVHKYGKSVRVTTSQLEDVFHEKFGKETLKVLAEDLESENPSLMQVLSEVWWHFLFSLYPISPLPIDPSLWAAALSIVGSEITGIDTDEQEISERYGHTPEMIRMLANQILEIELGTIND
ncbi:MAG: tetratricopeptide repeat protein [Bacillaceae bacterium]|nr:tetratricopeptide repeat protein [Bacillaceae bacterium]